MRVSLRKRSAESLSNVQQRHCIILMIRKRRLLKKYSAVFLKIKPPKLLVSEYAVNLMYNQKTIGIVGEDEVKGLIYIGLNITIAAGITPVTNTASAVIFKSLICLKTRNRIIFAFHPNTQNSSSALQVMIRRSHSV